MIGRSEQLRAVRAHIERTIAGTSGINVLLVTGEAGIGKTTLLTAVREEWSRYSDMVAVAHTECSTPLIGQDIGEVEALAPWIAIMNQLASDEKEAKFQSRELIKGLAMAWVRCVPVVGDVLESVADTAILIKKQQDKKHERNQGSYAANQDQVFQQYINFLGTLSQKMPLVLIIDDFHWADTSSTNLLFAAARQLAEKRVLFVVAYRYDDAASSRGGEGHPILHVINELGRYSLSDAVVVPAMTSQELDALLRLRYRNYRNNDEFEEWLTKVGGGNALFITQFLETLEEDNLIDTATGEIGRDFDTLPVPQSAYAVIQERIRRLNDETRELLRYASVEGETFTSRVLATISELPQLKLLQKLRIAEETHRVVVSLGKQRVYARETTAYQFAHGLMQRVMYDSLGEEERELVHEAVLDSLKDEWAGALDEGDVPTGMAARMAVHAMALGDQMLAAEVLIEGARASWLEFSGDETLRQIEQALGCIEKLREKKQPAKPSALSKLRSKKADRTGTLEAEALMLRAEVNTLRARHRDALPDYSRARELFEAAENDQRLIDACIKEAEMTYMCEDYSLAEEQARVALEAAEETGYRQGEISAARITGKILSGCNRYGEALELFNRALETARAVEADADIALALDSVGIVREILGEYEQAQRCYEESLEICVNTGNVRGEAFACNSMGTLFLRLHKLDEALDWFEKSREIFHTIGDRDGEARTLNNLGLIAKSNGSSDDAVGFFERSLETYRDSESTYGEAMVLTNVAQIHYEKQEIDKAIEVYRHCIELFVALGDKRGEATASYGLGYILMEAGKYDESRTLLERLHAIALDIGLREMEAIAQGTLGLLEKKLAAETEGDQSSAHRQKAGEYFTAATAILDELGSPEADEWREEAGEAGG